MKRNHTRSHRVPLSPQMMEVLEQQRELFRQKFGRDPRPEEPVFFNPEADQPEFLSMSVIESATVEFLKAMKVDPAFVHAYILTGLLVTEDNVHLFTQDEIEDWTDAVIEYRQIHAQS